MFVKDPFSEDRGVIIESCDDGIHIHGLSYLATSKLKGDVHLSLLSPDSFYIPAKFYEMGLVDEFKDLCGLSFNTHHFLRKEINQLLEEGGHKNPTTQAFDNASYALLGATKTFMVLATLPQTFSKLPELKDLSKHVGSHWLKEEKSNIDIYGKEDSIISLYKHNISNLIKTCERFDEGLSGIQKPQESNHVKYNVNLIKSLLKDIGLAANGVSNDEPRRVITINASSFKPAVKICSFMNEKYCIDLLTSVILAENNENLLSYDELNINNIDSNLRITEIDKNNVKAGILFDLLNGNKTLDEINNIEKELFLNKTTENSLDLNDFLAYWEENAKVSDPTLYQDYQSHENTINKEQNYLISRYMGGKAFTFIDYVIEITSSLKVMRDFYKLKPVYPKVITTRNSYDNYIIPNIIMKNQHLFNEYKHLIQKSFELYERVAKKGDYLAAQYCNILGVKTNYVVKANLRAFDRLIMSKGSEEYKEICQNIYHTIKTIHPNLAKFLRANGSHRGHPSPMVKRQKKLNERLET